MQLQFPLLLRVQRELELITEPLACITMHKGTLKTLTPIYSDLSLGSVEG